MTTKDFKTIYNKYCKAKLANIGSLYKHHHFDKLLDTCNSPYGYELFFPMTDGYSVGDIDLDSYIDLFHNVCHACDDDGDISFVCATIGKPDTFFKKDIELNTIFIMNGEWDNLNTEDILKYADFHGSHDKKATLKSYINCRFSWETIDFLHDLIPEFKYIAKLGSSEAGSIEGDSYYKQRHKMDKKFIDYIKSCKFTFNSKKEIICNL